MNNLIGDNIKKYRKIKKLSRNNLAKKIDISSSTLAGYENGYRLPNIEILMQISNELDISIDSLCNNKTNLKEIDQLNKIINQKDEIIDQLNKIIKLKDQTIDFLNFSSKVDSVFFKFLEKNFPDDTWDLDEKNKF